MAARVGFRCSYPGCSALTIGPADDSADGIANVGVAAHIVGAGVGKKSPRNNPNLDASDRKSIENGIWLCETHGKLIDSDEGRHSIDTLKSWKRLAEDRTRRLLGRSGSDAKAVETTFADMCATVESKRILREWNPDQVDLQFNFNLAKSEVAIFSELQIQFTNAPIDQLIEFRIWTPEDVIRIGETRIKSNI